METRQMTPFFSSTLSTLTFTFVFETGQKLKASQRAKATNLDNPSYFSRK